MLDSSLQTDYNKTDMAFIPEDAEWFLAQHVEEIRVQRHTRNIVHINYVLIRAKTPNEAYRKAIELGKEANMTYKNRAGETVTIRFLGLRNLGVIQDSLEHGCEIMFFEHLGMTKARIRKLVRKKKELEAFLPIRKRPGRPDYASKKIMDLVSEQLAKTNGTQLRRGGV
jgi:hypothetical protein